MMKNLLFFFCFFFVIVSNLCSPFSDIIAGINEDYFHVPLKPGITSTLNLKKVERIYLKYILSGLTEDPVCSLPKKKKIALCEQIFQQYYYKDLGIYLNKVAFFVNTPTCERRPVVFKTQIFFLDEVVTEAMYPCYGRHNPVRTNYITDNYYDKFYVSTGLTNDSVMVYVHEYDAESDWYNVFSYFENFELSKLPDVSIDVQQVAAELKLNKEIISTSNHEELEYVYIREQDHSTSADPICELEKPKKIALCQLIFDQYVYKMVFWVTLNKTGFFSYKPSCSELSLKIRYSKSLEDKYILQMMYPCFGRSRLLFGNVLKDRYLTSFFVSKGPRENSVFVYHRKKSAEGGLAYLIELLENVYVDDLEPMDITYEEVMNESAENDAYIQKIESLVVEKYDCELLRLMLKKTKALRELEKQLERERNRFALNEEEDEAIWNLFSTIGLSVLAVIQEEDDRLNQDKYQDISDDLTLNDKRFMEDNKKLREEIEVLLDKYKKEVEESGGRLDKNEVTKFIEKMRTLIFDENQDTKNRILENVRELLIKPVKELQRAGTSTTEREKNT